MEIVLTDYWTETKWWCESLSEREQHIVPFLDRREHKFSAECSCRPRLARFTTNTGIAGERYVHAAYDAREFRGYEWRMQGH
jgi:hypothetical protein